MNVHRFEAGPNAAATASRETTLRVVVVRKRAEADGVCSVELRDPGGRPLPAFTPGAHIDVHLPNGLTRQYSLCNPHRRVDSYRIAVLREPDSRGGSAWVHDALREGDEITISAPRNHFPLDDDAAHCVLLAGGIGITPLLCMATALAEANRPFVMHYCSRTRSRAAFVDELRAAPWSDRVNLHLDDEHGVFDAHRALQGSETRSDVYACGPPGFLSHVLSAARELGYPDDRLHREYFAAPPPATAAAVERPFDIVLARSGTRVSVAPDVSAVQALERVGVPIPVSCEQGVCGTCLTPVLAGMPDHRDCFLTPSERARNDIFTPCCSRALTPVLTLDL